MKVKIYQEVVNNTALTAAQSLPLANASAENIKSAFNNQTNCTYLKILKKPLREAGANGTLTHAITSNGTKLYLVMEGSWSLFPFLFSDLYIKPIKVSASAILRGAGVIDIYDSAKPFTLPETSGGSISSSEKCSS